MLINYKAQIRDCFNRAAMTYDKHCQLQNKVADKLLDLLINFRQQFNCIIDLGCGTGIVTEKLYQQLCHHEFYAIDIADQLLLQAKQRLANNAIHLREADFDKLADLKMTFDLVFANMSLHWSANLKATVQQIYSQLANDGLFVFSLPMEGSLLEINSLTHHPFYKFDEIIQQLAETGFCSRIISKKEICLFFTDPLSALKSIKATGTNYNFEKKSSGLLKKLPSLPPQLTYQIGFFLVEKSL